MLGLNKKWHIFEITINNEMLRGVKLTASQPQVDANKTLHQRQINVKNIVPRENPIEYFYVADINLKYK